MSITLSNTHLPCSALFGGTGSSNLTSSKILVGNDSNPMLQPTLLHWDNSNTRLGVGTSNPSCTLEVAGNINFTGNLTKNGTAFSSGGSGGMIAQSNQFAVTSSVPTYGYSSGTVTVPTVSISTLTSPTTYIGTVNLGSYGGASLTTGSTISLNINHNIGNSNYIAFFCPEGTSNLSVTLTSKGINSLTTAVKNISGVTLSNPSFNYMLMTGTQTTSNVPLANKVTLAYSTCNLTVYSGATSTNSVRSITGAATDPQGYAITYSNLTNPNNQYTVTGTNMTCTHAKTNRTQAVQVLATNTFNTDPTGQTITYNVTESNLAALSFTNSYTSNIATSNVTTLTYTLPATDQALALTYSVTNNGGTTASVSGNVLTYSSKGATGTYTITLNGGLTSSIMAEAALSYRAFSFNANETYTNPILYSFTTHTFTTAGLTGRTGPTLSQCQAAYSAASWTQNTNNFNVFTTGIQSWVVPRTGTYSFTVAGAKGSARTSWYGKGFQFTKNYTANKGDYISIICGQYSTHNGLNGGGGGGGGTFVFNAGGCIFAAGGGGGTGNSADLPHGVATRQGSNSPNSSTTYGIGGSNASGGTGGYGFASGNNGTDGSLGLGGTGGNFSSTNGYTGGGGGGGFWTGSAFTGGTGGAAQASTSHTGSDGGFGGGGAGGGGSSGLAGSGGAGGGYSGGGGGSSGGGSGGGGGSYSYDENPITNGSLNDGPGYVTVTFVA